LNELIQTVGANQAAGFICVLARVGPLFVLAPMFSAKMMPARARGICAVALAIGLAPIAMGGKPVPTDTWPLAELIVKEALIGLAFAFAVGVVFAALSIAGNFLDMLVGYSFGAIVDPITGNQSPVLSQIYALIGVMIFIAIGGDAWVIRGLAETYELVPLLAFPSMGALIGGANAAFANIFVAALQIAAPVLIAVTITDAAFGIVSRVSPQMNVFAVGLPAKIIVALLVMAASLPFVGGYLADSLEQGVGDVLRSIRIA
jgi:flagellar biosynthetic protein FliR